MLGRIRARAGVRLQTGSLGECLTKLREAFVVAA